MKSREISRSKIGPFSLACTDPYKGKGWEYQSNFLAPVEVPEITFVIGRVHRHTGIQRSPVRS